MKNILTDCFPSLGNAFTVQHVQSLQDKGISSRPFRLRDILRYKPYVVHLHWPENMIRFPDAPRTLLQYALFVLKVKYLKARKIPLIWHAHNIAAHESGMPFGLAEKVYDFWTKSLDGYICMSHASAEELAARYPALKGKPFTVIPHGHYRDCFPVLPTRAQAREKLDIPAEKVVVSSFGVIKGYKNVPALCRAFSALPGEHLMLRVGGKCSDPVLRAEIEACVQADPRIVFFNTWVHDSRYALETAASDLVALPYKRILNSGNVLFALSLNRPVLVTGSSSTSELAQTFGDAWIRLIDGELTAGQLDAALQWVKAQPQEQHLNLDALEWDGIASQVVAFYDQMRAYRHSGGAA